MKFSWSRAMTVARREYLFTISRRAFAISMVAIPLFYFVIMTLVIKLGISEAMKGIQNFTALAVVDSSGLFAGAPRQIRTELAADRNPFQPNAPLPPPRTYTAKVEYFADQPSAEQALHDKKVDQFIVIPANYLQTGKLRRYMRESSPFGSTQERPVTRWIARGLLEGLADSLRIERAVRPSAGMDAYALNRTGQFELKDDTREMFDIFVPFVCGMLIAISIVIGGQYLLRGLGEEKESRILESMLCMVTAEDLMIGKLVGLGGAGLTMVAGWLVMGALASGPAMFMIQQYVTPGLLLMMLAYFLCGYLFYASLMTGVGAVASSSREAQQMSVVFTILNMFPFYLWTVFINRPDSTLPTALSMIPPTAATSMMLRLAAPGSHVPAWQVAASLGLLLASTAIAIVIASRIFRVGLLMYGKTPTLPEILRWVRQG
jgi:ABC-2 type transport system permease protein